MKKKINGTDIETRGEKPNPLGHQLIMSVNHDMNHHRFNDYINTIDMWLTDNCQGKYSIRIINMIDYYIADKVEISFENPEDAAFFKLGPNWSELITEELAFN